MDISNLFASTLMKTYTMPQSRSALPDTFREDINNEDPPFCCTDGPLESHEKGSRHTIIRCVLSRKQISHSLPGLITLPAWPLIAACIYEADSTARRLVPAIGRPRALHLTFLKPCIAVLHALARLYRPCSNSTQAHLAQ